MVDYHIILLFFFKFIYPISSLLYSWLWQGMANSITPLSGCDIDIDSSFSSESDEEEVQSDSTVNAKEKDHVNSQIPETGMEFPSEEAAYNFYKSYAKEIGFNVRKGKVQKLSDGSIRKRFLFCTREGFREKKQSTETARYQKDLSKDKKGYQRKETRTGCKARVQFTVEKGKWVISQFNPDHNHDLEGKLKLQISGNSVDYRLDTTVNKACLVEETSFTNYEGYHTGECAGFLPDGAVNCPRVNGQSLINFFKDLQMKDPLFLYTMQVDAKNVLKNFFWRDGRSKMDYDFFGDVLILDMTPKIDPCNMFCVSFLGINHHGRFFLFGGALLLDNSIDSFIWLFRAFLDAMGRCQPKTIFTHGGQAIAKAIEVVLPESHHLLGVWHIIRNSRKYLSDCFNQPGFESCFSKCIFDCESEEEFEFTWETLLKQYDLHENPWLKTIYKMRETWSRFSSGGIFSAGIRSIQGCKGIDLVIQKLMRGTMTPLKFVQQFLELVEQQRQQELDEDACCNEGAPATILRNNLIEKEAANKYTNAIFKLFQGELLGCLSVGVEEISSNGMITKFKLTEEGYKEKIVEFNCLDSTVTCNCRKYGSVGILCVHALKVWNTKNIFHIPPRYILKRWTKSAKDGMVEDNQGGVTSDSPKHFQMWRNKLTHKALYLIAKSSATMDTCAITDGFLNKALESVEDVLRVRSNNNACHANEAVGMEIQKQLSDSGGINQQEESDVRPKSQLKRKCDNEVTMGQYYSF